MSVLTKRSSASLLRGSVGLAIAPPTEARSPRRKKVRKQTIRTEIRDILTQLLTNVLESEPPTDAKQDKAESMSESVSIYGLLKNPVSRKMDLILGARHEYFNNGNLTFYYIDNETLFTTFPAAGIYHGPYSGSKEIFVEVMAYVDGMYVCKAADKLRYVELMGENK